MTDHRAIGIELNNSVWDELSAGTITETSPVDERERLLYAAYTSTYHWLQVGTVANHLRGEHLISRVAARIGEAEIALRHARRCLELAESHPNEVEDWDLAFALEALARAEAATGDTISASSTFARAIAATAAVVDGDDRSVLEGELRREPWFGISDGD